MRKYTKYVLVLIVVILIGVFLYWRQSQNNVGLDGQEVPFQLIDRSNYGLYSEILAEDSGEEAGKISVVVVENNADWNRFWESKIRYPKTGGFDDVPEVDFSDSVVLAVLQGVKPTGGFYLNTDRVVMMKNGIVLNMNIVEPNTDDGQSQAVSSPYDVIKISKQEVFDHKNSRVQIFDLVSGEIVYDELYSNLIYKWEE